MKLYIYIFFFIANINLLGKPKKKTSPKYNLTYTFNIDPSINISGMKNILPKKTFMANPGELCHHILKILENKINVSNIEIINTSDKNKSIIITIKKDAGTIYKIQLDPKSQEIFDRVKSQNENHSIYNLTSLLPINHHKQQAVIEFINLLHSQSGSFNHIIQTEVHNNALILNNFHRDVPKKFINNISFIFVEKNDNNIKYTLNVSPLDFAKLKQSIPIESDNLLLTLINFFFSFNPMMITHKDPSKMKEYILSQGYNECDLLDIKYIENQDGYHSYIYIYLGKKLSVINVSFSMDNVNDELIKTLSEIKENFIKDKKILEKDYIPDEIQIMAQNIIKESLIIEKTIKEINSPQEGYNVNFHMKTNTNDFINEDIFIENHGRKNIFKLLKSKIGSKFSQKNIDEDKISLAKYCNEKVEIEVNNGSNYYSKKLVIKIGENFNMEEFVKGIMPNLSFALGGININKNTTFYIPMGLYNFPIGLNFHFSKDQAIKAYHMAPKIEFSLSDLILYLFNKKNTENFSINISGGANYRFGNLSKFFNNFYKRDFGLKINNNNHKTYDIWYYNSELNIFYMFKNNNTPNIFHNKNPNGMYYKYKWSVGRQKIFSLKDNIDFNILFSDQITKDGIKNIPKNFTLKNLIEEQFTINADINYNIKIYDFINQFNLQMLWNKKNDFNANDITLLGKNYKIDVAFNEKVHWIFHPLIISNYQIQSIDTILGFKIVFLMGFFFNGFIAQSSLGSIINEFYNGLMVSIKTQWGCLNLYIPLSFMSFSSYSNYRLNPRWIDFSIESSNSESFKKKESFNLKQTSLMMNNL